LKLRKYETLVIARPEFEKDRIKDLVSRLKERIERNGGQLLEVSDWGVRRLCYPIRLRGEKFFYGYYFLMTFLGNLKGINEIENYMKLIDDTIRFQTVRLSDTAEKIELAEPIWREQIVPEVKLREDGEGMEVVEPSRERKISREEMYKPKLLEKPVSEERHKEEAKEEITEKTKSVVEEVVAKEDEKDG